jgi:hypothetical protein
MSEHGDELQSNFARWTSQGATIRARGDKNPRPRQPTTYLGTLPRPALRRLVRAAVHPIPQYSEQPLGADFNQEFWGCRPPRSADETIARLIDLAENELRQGRDEAACAVARLIRARAPDEPVPHHLLSLVSPWLQPREVLSEPQRVDCHLALAEAHRMLGETEAAASNYRAALTFSRNLHQAHHGLALLRMPGDDYLVWLERLYRVLEPEIVVEIGVRYGESLAKVQPPAIAIGIDPSPTVTFPLKTETHIFTETSDEFFARGRFEELVVGRPLSVGFIDGLHLFEQALRDFNHLEAYCGPRSVILFHDTIPVDEQTQSRTCETDFYTGDVWKTILCLKHYRPDLDIFTIATPPTGLTVVTGLDPTSRVLTTGYDEAVARFIDTSFSAIECILESMLNFIPNDWSIVESRLKDRRII